MAAEERATPMRLKWQRHSSSCAWVSSAVLAMIAVVAFVLLVMLWPQWLASFVFDSRSYFDRIIDYEDMRTLSRDYVAFVRQEPEPVDDLTNVYVFSVTNANAVVERGVRVAVEEVGPFAYRKYMYRYDVMFSSDDSRVVTYKQWHRYEPVTDSSVCEELYLSLGDRKCTGTKCQCLDDSQEVVVVNPHYARMLHAESSQTVLAMLSENQFRAVEEWFTNDFITALHQHMSHSAVQSINEFRRDFGIFVLFEAAFRNLTASGYFAVDLLIGPATDAPTHCGLEEYGMSGCPWSAADYFATAENDALALGVTINITELAALLLEPRLHVSAVNLSHSAVRWMAPLTANGFFRNGAIDSAQDASDATAALVDDLTQLSSSSSRQGVQLFVKAFSDYISDSKWFDLTIAKRLVYLKWLESLQREWPCSLKYNCIWEASRAFKHGTSIQYSTFALLFDTTNAINTNLLSVYYEEYMPLWFDAWTACAVGVSDVADTLPATIFAAETGSVQEDFALAPTALRQQYQQMICDLASFLYDDLSLDTTFFMPYVVDFFNLNIPDYGFTVDMMEDLGYAQWTDGSVTLALLGAPSVYNVKRQGMWDIVPTQFGSTLLEYYAWVVSAGYPSMKPAIADGKKLLVALAHTSDASRALRRHIIWVSSTFYGDGVHFQNGVGAVGEVAFIVENNVADFNCTGIYSELCELVDATFMSSADECQIIADQYTRCVSAGASNWWIDLCEKFAVTSQEPNFGIQCTPTQVRGNPHPYPRKRGNVAYTMIYTWTLEMFLKRNGMWCDSPTNCQFDKGGLFIRTSVRNLLFDGFVDQTVLQFYNVKHRHDQLAFECAGDTTSACSGGLTVHFPNGSTVLWTRRDVDRTNYHSSNIQVQLSSSSTLSSVPNPILAVFPGKTDPNVQFQRGQDCQNRIMGGPAAPFPSCRNYMYTGKQNRASMFQLAVFKGNRTISARSRILEVGGYHSMLENYQAFGWEGFYEFPYLYRFRRDGLLKFGRSEIVAWNPNWLMSTYLTSAASGLLKKSIRRPVAAISNSTIDDMIVQEYVETQTGWDLSRNNLSPRDSYGMPYDIPIGMASVEDWAGMVAIVSTPHQWGNRLWGGPEYSETTGYNPDPPSHESFADVDWTSGQVVQGAHRKQVNLRVERSPLFPNLVSSQQRCNPPTKSFLDSSGYGCFMYIPLLWIDEQKFISKADFQNYYDHFYRRPEQTGTILLAGVAISIICGALSCACYARHFVAQRSKRHKVFVD